MKKQVDTSFFTLPPKILLKIVSYLSFESYSNLLLVSKQGKNFISLFITYLHVDLNNYTHKKSSIIKFIYQLKSLKHLHLSFTNINVHQNIKLIQSYENFLYQNYQKILKNYV